jgi:hypothetical protein
MRRSTVLSKLPSLLVFPARSNWQSFLIGDKMGAMPFGQLAISSTNGKFQLLYVKEEKRLRMSADVYCQNQNTRFGSHINIL